MKQNQRAADNITLDELQDFLVDSFAWHNQKVREGEILAILTSDAKQVMIDDFGALESAFVLRDDGRWNLIAKGEKCNG